MERILIMGLVKLIDPGCTEFSIDFYFIFDTYIYKSAKAIK